MTEATTSGAIKSYKVFTIFDSRAEMCRLGVHRARIAGIQGSKKHGARSIVLSYKYEDDIDQGDIIYYAGTSPNNKDREPDAPRRKDQTLDHPHNAALVRSIENKVPVRVIRGSNPKAKGVGARWAPPSGFRYDGLYKVTDAKDGIDGKGGNKICRFTLERLPNQPDLSLRDAQRSSPVDVDMDAQSDHSLEDSEH